jgi:soluble lytic murein transglycosylase-like protein
MRKLTPEEIIVGSAVAFLSFVIIRYAFIPKEKSKPNIVKPMRISNPNIEVRKYPTTIIEDFKKIAGSDYISFVDTLYQIELEPIVAFRQLHQESYFSPDVISCKKVSPAGAKGLAQFMPNTWKEYGVGNPCNVSDSLKAYPKLMKKLMNKYKGRLDLALAGYNWGGNRDVLEEAYKVGTPFKDLQSRIPKETYKYVASILQP